MKETIIGVFIIIWGVSPFLVVYFYLMNKNLREDREYWKKEAKNLHIYNRDLLESISAKTLFKNRNGK